MLAIRVREFGGPEVMQIEDVPDPVAGAGEIVVRIAAAGVNPVDAVIREGKFTELPSLPFTPGQDGAGTIESIGFGVNEFKLGDRVWIYGRKLGTCAEKVVCPVSAVHPLPDSLTFAQGAAVGTPTGAAWRSLFVRGKAQAGETVLIHGGTGSVGIAAIQLARAAGLIVIATASDDAGQQLAREQGAHHTAGHADYDAIRAFTPNGKGVSLILEEMGDKNLNDDLTILAPNGRVVVIGSHGPTEIDPRKTMGTELDIRGMSLTNAIPAEEAAMTLALTAALESGILRPFVGEEMPLAQIGEAHAKVVKGGVGKIVLTP